MLLHSGQNLAFAQEQPDLAQRLLHQPDAEVVRLSAEPCELKLGPESQNLKIGDKIELIVSYAGCTTVRQAFCHGFGKDRL